MATEQHLRQQLAAAYRLAALFGWEDTLYTHFSVRLPGDGEPRFLINPFGMMFDEVTASNLIVVDMQGKVVAGDAPANSAGFTIHSAVHMAREDAHCVIHTHTLPGMAVAACEDGLLQLNQISTEFYQRVGYHPYEGVAFDLDERARIQRSLGNNIAMILQSHGLAVGGPHRGRCVLHHVLPEPRLRDPNGHRPAGGPQPDPHHRSAPQPARPRAADGRGA